MVPHGGKDINVVLDPVVVMVVLVHHRTMVNPRDDIFWLQEVHHVGDFCLIEEYYFGILYLFT